MTSVRLQTSPCISEYYSKKRKIYLFLVIFPKIKPFHFIEHYVLLHYYIYYFVIDRLYTLFNIIVKLTNTEYNVKE